MHDAYFNKIVEMIRKWSDDACVYCRIEVWPEEKSQLYCKTDRTGKYFTNLRGEYIESCKDSGLGPHG